MKIHSLPLTSIGVSFLAGCGSGDTLEGTWDAVSMTYDGEDVTDEYLYTEDDGDCIYSARWAMVLDSNNRGGIFSIYDYDCIDESNSYTTGYGMYLSFEYAAGKWTSVEGYYSLSCVVPEIKETNCSFYESMQIRFRKG